MDFEKCKDFILEKKGLGVIKLLVTILNGGYFIQKKVFSQQLINSNFK